MSINDPRDHIKHGDMGGFRISLVIFCVILAALDGFDVLVMAFVAPSLSASWGLSPSALGALFSAGMIGTAIGAFFLAPLGDRIGRRPIALGCLALLAVSMLASAITREFSEMFAARLFTGIGVGAMLATINIIITEYANDRRRSLCNAGMSVGVPLGATLGGLMSVLLISQYGWQAPFIFGGVAAIVLMPFAWKLFPESFDYLIEKQPAGALERANQILPRLGLAPLPALPAARDPAITDGRLSDLVRSPLRAPFIASCVMYFCIMMTFYFVSSWTPKILTDAGLSITGGISGAMLLSFGGMLGCLSFGLLAAKVGSYRLTAITMISLFVMMLVFSNMGYHPTLLVIVALTLGFFLYSAVTTLYVVVPVSFPTTLRGSGTGIAMGVGRVGAVFGPYMAGMLIEMGWPREHYFLVLALPVLLAALMLLVLRAPQLASQPNAISSR
ncbi:MFS transporter [Pseudomonas aeruginosa]|uniref:MFS transporter n=1 Tax=Pseudomonas aeruginosa TaxID=287 RepID=UPI001A19A276|nr:MFS transporter [Pseudomonas aeruginosa]ELK4788217.1 MFS transporter [Pseudomonas aeruginosa]MBG6790986.1 MFS transporter [Pseudomonas aeruginosa]MBG6799183.1 MFS transporter [Pseudomonas aeruginosa]MEA8709982.1 MFS transporter [Pseudomonas aeruginosa]MEA8721793.1 MFS transporter [Pseudomonas aeruginosa]